MKLLYVGTLCDQAEYEKMLARSERRPSVASMVFESALLEGMRQNKIDIDVFSFPMIPDVFTSKVPFWGRKREQLPCGYTVTWITTLNVPVFKQISRAISSYRMIKRWLKERCSEPRAVMIYSVCPYVAPNIVRLCRKYHVKCFAIIPDLPINMFMNHKLGIAKSLLAKLYLKPALLYQNRFDGYVYLTQQMREVIGSDSPYTIVEGIADITQYDGISTERSTKRSIMYAGRLHEKYGLRNLIEAYLTIPHENVELWLFGSGDFEGEVRRYASEDSMIRFFGQVERKVVLEASCKATVLVNCRNGKDDYAKYSFPSKTIEYMLSGTPVLTTKLPGIPEEYEKYLYMVDTNEIENLADTLKLVLSKSDEELKEKGQSARDFIIKEKNSSMQARKIINLISMVIKENE